MTELLDALYIDGVRLPIGRARPDDEGTVAGARDIDTCLILGAGWPFFNGGICKHLDPIGRYQELFGAPLVGESDADLAPR